jgi:hypothetical protein
MDLENKNKRKTVKASKRKRKSDELQENEESDEHPIAENINTNLFENLNKNSSLHQVQCALASLLSVQNTQQKK